MMDRRLPFFLKEAQRDQEQEAKHRADQQRAADLLERREQGGGERARADDGLRDGDGQREQDQGGRVVDGDDGQQRLGDGGRARGTALMTMMVAAGAVAAAMAPSTSANETS